MKVGDLVRMSARSLEGIYGKSGVIVRRLDNQANACVFQVFWSKYGLGNRVAAHSLEKLNES